MEMNAIEKTWDAYAAYIRETPLGYVGIAPMIFTWAIVVGMDESGYKCRYCYKDLGSAMGALKSRWRGTDS